MVATAPLKAGPPMPVRREIKVFKDALAAVGRSDEAFICVFAPGWLDHFIYDEYYNKRRKVCFRARRAMREEYRAVVDAGFILQIDDPGRRRHLDMMRPAPTRTNTTVI
jgi:5-methyltetrahydropteroyltriglutamate--homocysteine methyltransferase